MNAALLLKHYGQIANAPDAVARLRRFILDLAVRGKLVEQDLGEQPSAELPERIEGDDPEHSSGPVGWQFSRLGAALHFQYGKGLKADERAGAGPVPVFGSNGIVGFTDQPLTTKSAIIVGRKGSAGALSLSLGPSWTTDVAYFVEAPSFFAIHFMLIVFKTLGLEKLGKGVKPGLSRSDAYEKKLCIPPLAEQHRIVAKVDELMGLCEQLEAARLDREAGRDKLTTASLARLNVPNLETFADDARFTLDALEPLTTRPDQIKQLRQTILNLAVRGKLVEQNPADVPASKLLTRVAAEKARLVSVGKLKKFDPVADFRAEGEGYAAPLGWALTNLQSICNSVTDGDHLPPPKAETGIPFLVIGDVRSQRITFEGKRFVSLSYYNALDPIRRPTTGDLLYTLVGSYGIPLKPAS